MCPHSLFWVSILPQRNRPVVSLFFFAFVKPSLLDWLDWQVSMHTSVTAAGCSLSRQRPRCEPRNVPEKALVLPVPPTIEGLTCPTHVSASLLIVV